jgi:hypothetical protein
LVSDIPAGDGNAANLFYGVGRFSVFGVRRTMLVALYCTVLPRISNIPILLWEHLSLFFSLIFLSTFCTININLRSVGRSVVYTK